MSNIPSTNLHSEAQEDLLRLQEQVATATQFIHRLSGSDTAAFASFDDKGKDGVPPKRIYGSLEDCLPELLVLNEVGAGIFVTVNQTDGVGHKMGNIVRVRAVFVDLDGAPLVPVEAWTIAPHMVVETSPGRWHAYWIVDDLPLDRFTDVQKALASHFGGDPAVCDLGRVMRIPGFHHLKSDPFMVTIKRIDLERRPISADDMFAALGLSATATAVKATKAAPSTKSVGSSLIGEGSRNSELTAIAGRLRRNGDSAEVIEEALLLANDERCDPPLSVAEVKKIAKSIAHYAPSKDPTGISNTDTGNAQRFVDQHRDDLRYVPEMKKWVYWDDGFWKIDTSNRAIELAKLTAKAMFDEAAKCPTETIRTALARHASQSLNIKRLHAMIELAKSDASIVLPIESLNANDFMLGVANGVIDLRTGKFRPAERDDFLTLQCGSIFDAYATCPTFEKFLARVTGGDIELQAFLQRLVGYSLTGSTREHCLAFFYGHGANGKSTFLEAIQRLTRDYACQAQPETFMAQRNGGANNDIARLVGKRLVISNETREGSHLEENLIKQLVGGDTVTARFLRREFFEFKPKFKLMIAGNHKPVIKGDDDGIWRRFHLVPFDQAIPEKERDKSLGEKLAMELPGILNWAIEGCLAWQTIGLKPPKVVTDATRCYRNEMDLLGEWMSEECDIGPALHHSSKDLYENYHDWCEGGGIKAMTSPTFGRKLETRGIEKIHGRINNRFRGIAIKLLTKAPLSLAA